MAESRAKTRGPRYARNGKLKSGQQTGSKRPVSRIGFDAPAPKKGERPLKGTRRPGAPKKTAPKK
jgi:hypothetical protein